MSEKESTTIATKATEEEESAASDEKLWLVHDATENFLGMSVELSLKSSSSQLKEEEEIIAVQRLPDGTRISSRDMLKGVQLEHDKSVIVIDDKTYEENDEEKESNIKIPKSLCIDSVYGKPLNNFEAKNLSFKKGLVYHAHLYSDETLSTNPKVLKPRRPTLSLRHSDFLSSLNCINEKWIFSGVLNGWPGLGYNCPLEVLSITYKPKKSIALTKGKTILRWWHSPNADKKNKKYCLRPSFTQSTSSIISRSTLSSNNSPTNSTAPTIPPTNILYDKQSVRVTLRTPSWASRGWTPTSPGFVWYYNGDNVLLHGTDMLQDTFKEQAKSIHIFQHRYAMPEGKREGPKDLLTFHAAILLEWEWNNNSPQHTTLVELALVNGIGGYRGRANWYHDKDNDILGSKLYRTLPPQMILPWRTDMCEIRLYDLPHCPSFSDFQQYLKLYTGPGKRFLDPHVYASHPVRLSYRSKKDIMQYCLNYVNRDPAYREVSSVGSVNERNCQSFAADFFAFCSGKKGIEPISKVSKALMGYKPRMYYFLYDADMYLDPDDEDTDIDQDCDE